MLKTTLKIDGMACSMCEAHINEAIRKACPKAKKVASSFAKGEATFLTEETPDEERLRQGIDGTGYILLSCETKPYQKKGLFGR